MTKTVENKTLGLTLSISIPATLDLAVEKFGADVVYASAQKHVFYNPWNSAFRKELVKAIEEKTGKPRRQQVKLGQPQFRTTKKGEQTPIFETEATYVSWILNEEKALTEDEYANLGQSVADTIPFEFPTAEDDTPDKVYFNQAKTILAMIEAGSAGSDGNPVTAEGFIAKWEAANIGRSFDTLGEWDELTLAKALQIDADRRAKEVNHLV